MGIVAKTAYNRVICVCSLKTVNTSTSSSRASSCSNRFLRAETYDFLTHVVIGVTISLQYTVSHNLKDTSETLYNPLNCSLLESMIYKYAQC